MVNKTQITLFFICLIFLSFGSCSKKLSLSKINKPAKAYFEETLNKEIDSMRTIEGDTKEYIEQYRNDAFYRFQRKLKAKKIVFDSIGFDFDELIIIEKSASGYSGVYEEMFFYYDDKCIMAYYNPPGSNTFNSNPKLYNINIETQKKDDRSIAALYETFKAEKISLVIDRTPFEDAFGYFLITKYKDNKISYYTTASYHIGNFKPIEKIK